MQPNGHMDAMTLRVELFSEQHGRLLSGDKAGPRRMPTGCGADRNGPRLGNTGALTTRFFTGVR